jgi:hypothetical protein
MERRARSSEAIARRTAARRNNPFHSRITVNFIVQLAVKLTAATYPSLASHIRTENAGALDNSAIRLEC